MIKKTQNLKKKPIPSSGKSANPKFGKPAFKKMNPSTRPLLRVAFPKSNTASKAIKKNEVAPKKKKEPFKKAVTGDIVTGKVTSSGSKGIFIRMKNGQTGRVMLKHISVRPVTGDDATRMYPVDKEVSGLTVLSVDDKGRIELAPLQKSSDLSVGQELTAVVRRVEKYGVLVNVGEHSFRALCILEDVSESNPRQAASKLSPGDTCPCVVTKIENGRVYVSFKDSKGAKSDVMETVPSLVSTRHTIALVSE